MNWVPETIDALTRMAREFGFWNVIFLAMMVFAMFIAYRHASAVLKAIETFLSHKTEEIGELKRQTAVLNKIEPALEKIHKMPSDWVDALSGVCKASPHCQNFLPKYGAPAAAEPAPSEEMGVLIDLEAGTIKDVPLKPRTA